jgi:hypothetical protein
VNPLRSDATSIAPHLAQFEKLYRAQDLPLIVRVPSLIAASIDRELEQYGLSFEGESCEAAGRASPESILPVCKMFR